VLLYLHSLFLHDASDWQVPVSAGSLLKPCSLSRVWSRGSIATRPRGLSQILHHSLLHTEYAAVSLVLILLSRLSLPRLCSACVSFLHWLILFIMPVELRLTGRRRSHGSQLPIDPGASRPRSLNPYSSSHIVSRTTTSEQSDCLFLRCHSNLVVRLPHEIPLVCVHVHHGSLLSHVDYEGDRRSTVPASGARPRATA
jgi:hypothetical protein